MQEIRLKNCSAVIRGGLQRLFRGGVPKASSDIWLTRKHEIDGGQLRYKTPSKLVHSFEALAFPGFTDHD